MNKDSKTYTKTMYTENNETAGKFSSGEDTNEAQSRYVPLIPETRGESAKIGNNSGTPCAIPSPADEPHVETEKCIKAEPLFDLLDIPDPDFRTWVNFQDKVLRSTVEGSPFRLGNLSSSVIRMTMEYAVLLTRHYNGDLKSAMAYIILDEALYGSNCASPGYANRMIRFLNEMFCVQDSVVAKWLQEFLDPDECFDCWITRLSKTHKMVHLRDYEVWEEDDMYVDDCIPHESDKNSMTFSMEFAAKVARAGSSRRSALLRVLLGDEKP